MLRRLGYRSAALFRAITPDPFVIAVLLTVLVFGAGMAVDGREVTALLSAWRGDRGFWSLLAFSMQMVLILVTGHALAAAPIVERLLRSIARWPSSAAQANALVSAVAILTCLANWGLGLIVGALLAREVGRSCAERGIHADYPLLAAAGYSGMMCWHGGLSGSAPLMMTESSNVQRFLGNDLTEAVGVLTFSDTVFSALNVTVTGGLLALLPMLFAALAPRPDDSARPATGYLSPIDELPVRPTRQFGSWIERVESSRVFTLLAVAPMVGALAVWAREGGLLRPDPNVLNLAFLALGLILHQSLQRYARSVGSALTHTTGIVLQYPFYAGIMGMMRSTGLARRIGTLLARLATRHTFALLTMASAAFVNLFVPSGGGQWAIQGPVAIEASVKFGAPPSVAVMAVAYGDQLTNMLQPFWALPLLAITGVQAREIVGYTVVAMGLGAIWITACLVWFIGI